MPTKLEDISLWTDTRDEACRKYIDTEEYAKDKRASKELHYECCERNNYCTFWRETWFIWTMIGVSCLIAILCAVCIAWACCCRDGRSRGRGDCDVEFEKEKERKDDKEND